MLRESAPLSEIIVTTKGYLCPTHNNLIRRNELRFRQCLQENNSCKYGHSPIGMGPIVGLSVDMVFQFEDQQSHSNSTLL